jgi:hypothetical protein
MNEERIVSLDSLILSTHRTTNRQQTKNKIIITFVHVYEMCLTSRIYAKKVTTKLGANSGALERCAVPAPLVATIVLI